MKNAVAYYRVSTDRQGESGLGLEAQVDSVRLYSKAKNVAILREFTEVESGKRNTRPILNEALLYCSETKSVLIIAKLDRLGRNVAFISSLMESKVQFVAVDNPEANHLILHIMAAFAEYEREQISERTKAALRKAKERGIVLGSNGKVLAQQNRKSALAFALRLKPVIENLRRDGFGTIKAITDELNRKKVPTYREGSRWHNSTVHALLRKIDQVDNF